LSKESAPDFVSSPTLPKPLTSTDAELLSWLFIFLLENVHADADPQVTVMSNNQQKEK
jgi:hypothetical protein